MGGLTGFQDGYNTSGALQTNYTTSTETFTPTQRLPPIRDTSSTSEVKSTAPQGVYQKATSQPALPNPGVNSPGGIDLVLHMINNFGDQVLSMFGALPKAEDNFPTDVKNQVNGLSEEQLAALGDGDPVLGKTRLNFAISRPGLNYSPALEQASTQIRENAIRSSGNGPNAAVVAAEDLTISGFAQGNFQKAVMELGLTPEEEKQLYYAHEDPSAVASLPPKLQQLLKQVETSSLAKTQNQFGFPDHWLPGPDGAKHQAAIGKQLGKNIDNALFNQLWSGQITKSQYNEMRTLHFTSETTPNAQTLKPILDNVTQTQTKALQKEQGFPDNFSPPTDQSDYNAILHGAYYAEFTKQLKNATPALTADQTSQAKASLLSASAFEELPPNLQGVVNSAKTNATAQISKLYGVSSSWNPDSASLTIQATKAASPNQQAALTGISQLNEWISGGKSVISDVNAAAASGGLPPPPSTHIALNYLRVVSLALIAVQEMMYTSSENDAKLADMFNKIQNNDKLGQLRKQQEKIQEVMKKEKKLASLGPLQALFQWLINIILTLLLGPIGWAIMMNAIMQARKQLAEGKSLGNVMENMNFITSLGQTAQDIGKTIGGPFGKALGNFGEIGSTAFLAFICPMAFFWDLMVGQGSFIQNFCQGVGMSPDQTKKITQNIQMAAQMLLGGIALILTGGTSVELMVANIAKFVADSALDTIDAVQDIVTPYINFVVDSTENAASEGSAEAAVEISESPEEAPGAIEGSEAGEGTSEATTDVLNNVKSFFQTISKSASEIIDGLTDGVETVARLERGIRESERAQEIAQEALAAANEEGTSTPEEIAKLEKELLEITEKLEDLMAELGKAKESVSNATTETQNSISQVVNIAQTLPNVVQSVNSIRNNLIQAQIVKLQGQMESLQILVDQFVKQIMAIVKKLMDMVQSYGQDIKEIGQQIDDMYSQASQTVSSIFA